MWRAIALIWIGALVDPPIAEQATMVFSNALRVRMSEGLRSSCTMATIRSPVTWAICARSRYGAGIAPQPGSDMPSASASAFMVEAVPMVLQWPTDGADDVTRSINSL